MNAYYGIATEYFRQMEGWHLYRKPGFAMLWIWLVLATLWVAFFYPLFRAIAIHDYAAYAIWFMVVLAFELAVLIVGSKIQKRKKAALIKEVNSKYSAAVEDDQTCRALVLTRLLGQESSSFLDQAKEICELLKLRDQFRGKNEIEPGFFWRSIYDRDSKPRLLAVTLAGITVLTALTIRSLPEGSTFFELIADDQILASIGLLVMVSAGLFSMLIGARVIGGVVWHAASLWVAKMFPSTKSMTALSYLVRDLVTLHSPLEVGYTTKGSTASKTPDATDIAQSQVSTSGASDQAQVLSRRWVQHLGTAVQLTTVSILAFQALKTRNGGRSRH